MKKLKKKPKYWIFTIIEECPICGRGHTYKERRYTKKPKNPMQRYEYSVINTCYCIY